MAETNKVALLNEELEQVRVQRETLRSKHKGAVLPEEARSEDEALVTRAKKITDAIEIERQKERDHVFEETAKYMDEPKYQINRAINPDDESKREMARAGWESKGGMIMRQTSLGEIAFCPEEVLYGPMPTKAEDARYFRDVRASFQPTYRQAYKKWLSAASKTEHQAWASLNGEEQNALSEGAGIDGGFVVPPDVQAEILIRLPQVSVMRRLCRVIPTSRDKVVFPAAKAATLNGTIYSSGFVGTIVGETPAFSDTDPQFEQFEISIKKFRTTTRMSNDWLADAQGNMLAFLSQGGAENLGLVEDYYFINGDGTALQPLGLLNSSLSTTTVEGSTTDTISNTISNAGSAPLIDGLPYLVPSQYVNRASTAWLAARASEGKIRALVDANGRPWWQPQQTAGGAGATPAVLGGYPFYNSDFMPVGGTNLNKVLAFGDFSAYIIAQRAAMSTIVLRERFADSEQTGIIIVERAGGGLWNTDAMYLGIV